MKPAGLFVIILFTTLPAFAQYRKSIQVKAGEDAAQAFSPYGFYRFPQFSQGTLYSKNRNGNSSMVFNYNMLSGNMQFINAQGDTMDMVNPGLFDSMMIDKTVFYYKPAYGFLEVLAAAYPLKLVKKVQIKMKPAAVGAYDGTSTTSAIKRINQYTIVTTTVYNLTITDDMMIKEAVDWYWQNGTGELMKATKKNLLSLLSPDLQNRAQTLIREKKIDFDRENDLAELVKALR